METVIGFLRENPLLLLFIVAGIGYPLGQLKIGGTRLGVAAVLFVGLAIGALDPNLKLPEVLYQLGLVLFVYCIGLSSGSVFFDSLKRQGIKDNLLVIAALLFAALLAAGLHLALDIKPPLIAGMFAGSLTNTPALAGALEHIKAAFPGNEAILSEPVIAYSLTYPMGVLGMILAIYILQRLWKIDYNAEAQQAREFGPMNEPLFSQTLRITQSNGMTIAEFIRTNDLNLIFGRRKRAGKVEIVRGDTTLWPDDLVSMVGSREDLQTAQQLLGEISSERIEFDLSQYDKRRVFVSSSQTVGRRLRELNLLERYGAIVTRLRRGDLEMLPHGNTTLSLGDQVRVIAPHENLEAVIRLFGDSYRGVSELDILTFSFGLALGMLLGFLPIPLPGGVTLKLGIAGGPLIISLILGALGRTGPIIWHIPYSTNLSLRQIGLVIFLAGIGTRSGYAFISTFSQGNGPLVFLGGALITCFTALFTLWVGYRRLHIPMGILTGILAGLQTQPAVLGFAQEQTRNEMPNIGYATVYPIAMILKIILAQVLLILFL